MRGFYFTLPKFQQILRRRSNRSFFFKNLSKTLFRHSFKPRTELPSQTKNFGSDLMNGIFFDGFYFDNSLSCATFMVTENRLTEIKTGKIRRTLENPNW